RRIRDCHPLWCDFPDACAENGFIKTPRRFLYPGTSCDAPVWAVPLSLAATDGIDFSFFSCGYLDVSVPRVRPLTPMRSAWGDGVLPPPRFRIQKSPDRRPFAGSPGLIAGCHVFRRLSMPRHPPYTLTSLATFTDHRP